VGPFKTAPRGYKNIVVVVDKLTKWIEVCVVATVTSKEAAKFIEDITHWFGVPNRIVTDLVLTDKRRIPLRSASVRTPHLFHHGIPKVLVNPRSKGITSVRLTTTH
jgi:hypothetical protein